MFEIVFEVTKLPALVDVSLIPVKDPVPRLTLLIILFVQLNACVLEVKFLTPIKEALLVGAIEIFEKLFCVMVIAPPLGLPKL